MSDEALLAANRSFYDALESGDIDLMGALWAGDDGCVCVHPAAAPIHGRAAVLRSLALIMANTSYIQFFLTDVEVTRTGDRAVVTCTENILASVPVDQVGDAAGAAGTAPDPAGGDGSGLVSARAACLNAFVRRDGAWRLWVHHATSVLSGGS